MLTNLSQKAAVYFLRKVVAYFLNFCALSLINEGSPTYHCAWVSLTFDYKSP